jgi:hypothetical protein
MKSSRPSLVTVAISAAVALVVGSVSAAFANHVFPDVPNSHQFHGQIGAMYDAGCYTGFPNGEFRPRDPANRGQFAFWLHNCSPRVASTEDFFSGLTAGHDPQVLGDAPIINGAQAGNGVFANLQANISVFSSDCDECEIAATIVFVGGAPQPVSRTVFLETVLAAAGGSFGEDDDAASVGNTVILDGPGPFPFAVEVEVDDPLATEGSVEVDIDLTVSTFPLDGLGNGAGQPPAPGPEVSTEHGTIRLLRPLPDGRG